MLPRCAMPRARKNRNEKRKPTPVANKRRNNNVWRKKRPTAPAGKRKNAMRRRLGLEEHLGAEMVAVQAMAENSETEGVRMARAITHSEKVPAMAAAGAAVAGRAMGLLLAVD